MVLILMGEAGVGKDSIQKELVDRYGFTPIVSTTSRPMREGEVDGKNYYFVTKEQFMTLIAKNNLIEYRSYDTLFGGKPDTWYYGVERRLFPRAEDFVVILDLDGAKSFKEYYGEDSCCICYIGADDAIRRERAEKRGSFDEAEWNRRAESDAQVFSKDNVAMIANTSLTNNGDLSACVDEIYFRFMAYKLYD